jgi:nucleoside-diphosphate-sugar epimerase
MHALVTGGGGFLGRYIVEQLLARGEQVRVIARVDYPELTAAGVEVVRGDVADSAKVEAACAGIDCVFHVAALAGISVRWAPFERANVLGTENVVAACRQEGVARLVFTSSPSVTFAGGDQCRIDESVPPDFEWLRRNGAWYSLSKATAERTALAGGANGNLGAIQSSLRVCALRPHLIWGPRDAHLIPRLIERARSGRLRRVGDGTNLVDVCYVENAAAAHLAAADALADPQRRDAVNGKAYYISQGRPVNCWGWIDEVLALAELPPVQKTISHQAARRLGGACEAAYRLLRLKSEPPMTRFLAGQLAKSHWYDISAARRDLGFVPQVSTAEGMKRLGKWLDGSTSGISG